MGPRQGGAFLTISGRTGAASAATHATRMPPRCTMSSYTIADSWVPAGQRSGDQTCIMWMHWLRDGWVVGRGHRRGHILQHVIGMVGTATWTRTAIDRAIIVSHVDIMHMVVHVATWAREADVLTQGKSLELDDHLPRPVRADEPDTLRLRRHARARELDTWLIRDRRIVTVAAVPRRARR